MFSALLWGTAEVVDWSLLARKSRLKAPVARVWRRFVCPNLDPFFFMSAFRTRCCGTHHRRLEVELAHRKSGTSWHQPALLVRWPAPTSQTIGRRARASSWGCARPACLGEPWSSSDFSIFIAKIMNADDVARLIQNRSEALGGSRGAHDIATSRACKAALGEYQGLHKDEKNT